MFTGTHSSLPRHPRVMTLRAHIMSRQKVCLTVCTGRSRTLFDLGRRVYRCQAPSPQMPHSALIPIGAASSCSSIGYYFRRGGDELLALLCTHACACRCLYMIVILCTSLCFSRRGSLATLFMYTTLELVASSNPRMENVSSFPACALVLIRKNLDRHMRQSAHLDEVVQSLAHDQATPMICCSDNVEYLPTVAAGVRCR